MALLEVRNLATHFFTREGTVRAVDGVGFALEAGKTLGIVGESGSGKSVTALSIMGLIPIPPAKIVSGDVLFEGRDLTKLSEKQLEDVRGREIAMIFQDPMTSLNPTLTIGTQITETIFSGGFGIRPMIESAVTDFPQPDSPTIPSVLPFSSEKLTPSTARTVPSRVKKCVRRSSTSSRATTQVSRVRGSRASRRPSATKLAQRTSVAIATEGTMIAVG